MLENQMGDHTLNAFHAIVPAELTREERKNVAHGRLVMLTYWAMSHLMRANFRELPEFDDISDAEKMMATWESILMAVDMAPDANDLLASWDLQARWLEDAYL